MTDISIIIPTHNRAALAAQAVRSAAALDYPADHYEIVVVDNASTDSTPEVIQQLQSDANGSNLRYVREDEIGLHNARHAGARAAKGEVLVFTDDDATFDTGWLQAYANAFRTHSEMVAAGGPVRPVWEVQPPQWLLEFIGDCKIFGTLSLMEPYQEFHLDEKGFFFGVNMAIRRDVLFEVGGFNPELVGTSTVGDGESGLNRRLREKNLLIGYVPDALVYHHIPPERMTVDYLRRWQAHLAGARLYARYHRHMPTAVELAAEVVKIALKSASAWMLASFIRSRTNRLAVSWQLRAALGYAHVRYVFQLIYDERFREMVTHQDWLNSPPVTQKPK